MIYKDTGDIDIIVFADFGSLSLVLGVDFRLISDSELEHAITTITIAGNAIIAERWCFIDKVILIMTFNITF